MTTTPSKPKSLGDILQDFAQHRQLMQQELQKVIVGQHEVIEQLFAAIFTRGHCLLEGVPGLAKTLMVSMLADEINRTPPKTQAALLQAMQEREVTVGRQTFELPDPFFVIATQNPIEQEGTYPLPEAQLDRFMFNIKVDYPSLEEEKRIISMTSKDEVVEMTKVLSGKAIT